MRLDTRAKIVVGLREADIQFEVLEEFEVDTVVSVGDLVDLFASEKYARHEFKIYFDEFDMFVVGCEVSSTNGVREFDGMDFFDYLVIAKLHFTEIFKKEPKIILMSTLEG